MVVVKDGERDNENSETGREENKSGRKGAIERERELCTEWGRDRYAEDNILLKL